MPHSSHASALRRTPDMSKMEEVAASKPNFTGVWVLVKQSNSDAFLKVRTPRMECTCGGGVYTLEQARGANYIMRKASKALTLKHTITQVQYSVAAGFATTVQRPTCGHRMATASRSS